MIKIVKILFITLFLLSFGSYSFAENKISFIDVNYIFINSDAGKKVNKEIKKKNEKINNELSSYKKKIEDEKKKLVNQKNVLSKEELQKQTRDLEKKVKEYNGILSKNNKELNRFTNKAKSEFFIQLSIVTQKFAIDNSIEMILKKKDIFIGKKELDITQDVMNLFNKEVKVIKIN
jgi:outer membrane protein|tara:strand:+ start:289 stop:816 length:528 start_codon:yes stop_codon:yes gene_type:complete